MRKGTIRQISLFAANRPGRLAKIAGCLHKAEINILAFTIAEAGDFGVIRMVVNDPDRAHSRLQEEGFAVSVTEVIAVQTEDVAGGLFKFTDTLGREGVNIDYAYAFVTRSDLALLILRVDNLKTARRALKTAKARMVEEEEIARMAAGPNR